MRCRGCGAPIEDSDGIWWTAGTCRSTCYGPNGEWMAHIPDMTDVDGVEEWLTA